VQAIARPYKRAMCYEPPAMEAPAARLEVGADFAERYRVLRCLKHGGMGSVYEVLDRRTDRLRALKVMQPDVATDPDMRVRFEQEAMVVVRVRSDHIVEVVDAGICEPDTPFLVMELLHGEDLAALLAKRKVLEAEEVVSMLSQVASGLDKVHEEGVVHRDLKLENLFVSRRDDGSLHVKIVDFGVAKIVHYAASLSTTRSLGTPLFMAPEQLTGEGTIGPAADLYALAHAAFCLLVGKPYWFEDGQDADNPYAFISIVVRGVVEPACARARRFGVTLPASFDPWFAKATAKRPSRRFESASEQIAALRLALGVQVPGATVPVQVSKPRVRLAWVALALGGILSLAVAPLVCSSTHADDAERAPPQPSPIASEAPASATATALAAPPTSASEAALPPPASAPRPSASLSASRSLRVPTATPSSPAYDPLDDP
jgi:eukaryotic-like serine/threonine-protein kinase